MAADNGVGSTPARPRTPATERIPILVALLLSTGIASDIQSVALSPLVGTMARELSLTTAEVSWTLNALLLGGAIGVGVTSRLGDLVGHRKVLLPLVLLGLLGAVLGALANGFLMLLVGRFLLGLAVATPLAWGLLRGRADAERIKTSALSLGTVIAVFTPLSLVLGGALLAIGVGWQAIFWVIAVAYIAMLVCVVMAPETPPTARARVSLDWPGAIGLGVWLTALLLGISQGNARGWTSPFIVTLFAVAITVLALWIIQQRRAPVPLMDFSNMNMRQMVCGYVALGGVTVVASGLYLLLPSMLQMPATTGYGRGFTVFLASLPLIMILPGSFLADRLTRRWLAKWGPRRPMVIGGVTTTLSFVAVALFHDPVWLLYVWITIYGVGVVVCYNVGWTMVAASGRQDNMSITFGVLYAGQKIAGAVATAVILVGLNPGSQVLPAEAVYRWGLGGLGVVALVCFILVGVYGVPRSLEDRHAVSVAVREPAVGAAEA